MLDVRKNMRIIIIFIIFSMTGCNGTVCAVFVFCTKLDRYTAVIDAVKAIHIIIDEEFKNKDQWKIPLHALGQSVLRSRSADFVGYNVKRYRHFH